MERKGLKMIDDVVLDWFCLINTKGIGPKTFWAMMRSYKTAKESLKHVSNPFPSDKAKKILKSYDCEIMLANEDCFPKSLRRSASCPPILFYKGDKTVLLKNKIAIIGARNASISGKSIAKNFAENLSNDFSIVSGMAKGIDTSAHIGSLENKNSTIAVLPFGFDNIYPKENTKLFQRISENGIVLTESPPGMKPDQGMFQARNRIIALLSNCMIVIEAAAKSGTMSTAQMALDLGCEVMVVPGSPLDPRSYGSNLLIKNGALLVQNHHDVLESFGVLEKQDQLSFNDQPLKKEYEMNNDESEDICEKVLSVLSTNAVSMDEIAIHTNLSMPELLCVISDLEISGKIVKCGSNAISLA